MKRRPLALLLLAAACASAPKAGAVAEARRADEEALATRAADLEDPKRARHWLVVQKGDFAASASLPDDALRAAATKDGKPLHRFVFRPADRGDRVYRMVFLAEGGLVAGRKFLADLGLEVAGRPPVIRKKGGGFNVSAQARLSVELESLDGAERRTVEIPYDPEFDGGLLVTRELASALSLERFELPGAAEVMVGVGRPFRAHRAIVVAKVGALNASGTAEVVYETAPLQR